MGDRGRLRGRSVWGNVRGGIVVFLVEAAVVAAVVVAAIAVAALMLWIV